MSDLISLNKVLEIAASKGGSQTYETFREAVYADTDMTSNMLTLPQGPKRKVVYVPRDVGVAFADRYAEAHPKKKSAPITQNPAQMELPLESDDRLNRLEALVIANHNRLINIERMVHQLAKTWEALEDDQK